ncbi:MAG: FliA/WhiG family RNA polymerase sigma factor [Deltaproteobacteria bacterium]|nr:FliA/WhiG family RNA polymerase sigma factor [Deltaproteobacteria bacterium]
MQALKHNPYLEKTKASKEDVVLEYAPMVKFIANRLAARLPSEFQVDDLIQSGMIGLLEAMDKFDENKGVKFKTYAEFRVKGAMLDDLRRKDWIPRSVRDNSHKLENAYTKLRSKNIDHPNDQQLAKELEVKPKELPVFLSKAKPIPLLSLEEMGNKISGDDHMEVLETIACEEDSSQLDSLVEKETNQLMIDAIEKLPEKEKLVLSLYYNEELNLREIGEVLDITESRASQLRTKAIAMLRSLMRSYLTA